MQVRAAPHLSKALLQNCQEWVYGIQFGECWRSLGGSKSAYCRPIASQLVLRSDVRRPEIPLLVKVIGIQDRMQFRVGAARGNFVNVGGYKIDAPTRLHRQAIALERNRVFNKETWVGPV